MPIRAGFAQGGLRGRNADIELLDSFRFMQATYLN